MISDRETNKIFLSNRLKLDYPKTCSEIEQTLITFGIQPNFLPQTKDIWVRDYMPIQVNKETFIEYRYDPDYLQGTTKNTREIKTYPDMVCDAISLPTKKTDIILDGGNVVRSKNTIILTDKVVAENKRTYNKHQLLDKLHELFQVDKVVLIPWDDKCEYGYSDGMLRFINDDTVLISGFYDTADLELKEYLLKSLKKAKLNWEWLRCFNKEKERNITYINFLQTKDLILIPKLNILEDEVAFEQVSKYYNDYAENNRIAEVDMSEIAKLGGALNCISWTIKQ
ncbi:agmatine deiminase family protein [uncultured Draconibacterium sp.]|uniref:agmatine deiminase family protein n=1 Tax=uncultured Draconibacterium sp. TaxID=1573823 RepID=UPI0029C75290|nr:agmatine deiminase family protein [uncultured Draconibacterium sp.]